MANESVNIRGVEASHIQAKFKDILAQEKEGTLSPKKLAILNLLREKKLLLANQAKIRQEKSKEPSKPFFDSREAKATAFQLGGATVGAAFGGIPGAFFGGTAGRATFEILAPLLGEEQLQPSQVVKESLIGGATEGVGEATGVGLIKGTGKVLSKGLPRAKKGLDEVRESLRPFTPDKFPTLTPAQSTEGFILDTLEGAARTSFAGGDRIRTFTDIVQPEALRNFADDIAESVGPRLGPTETGELFLKLQRENNEATSEITKRLFQEVDELLGGEIIDVPITKTVPKLDSTGKPLIDRFGKAITEEVTEGTEKQIVGGASVNTDTVTDFVKNVILKRGEKVQKIVPGSPAVGILNRIANVDGVIPFSQAQFLRSELLRVARDEGIDGPLAGKIAGLIDKEIGIAAKNISPKAEKAFRAANRFVKASKKRFSNDLAKKIADKNPSAVMRSIFTGEGATDKIRIARKILDPPGARPKTGSSEAWKAIKSSFLQEEIFGKSQAIKGVPGETGLKATKLTSKLIQFKNEMKAAFTPTELKRIEDITRAADFQQNTPSTPGSFAITLLQVGAAGALFRFDLPAEGAAILVGPKIIAEMATRPSTARLLAEGLKLSKGKIRSAGLVGRLTAELVRISSSNPRANDMVKIPTDQADNFLSTQAPVQTPSPSSPFGSLIP